MNWHVRRCLDYAKRAKREGNAELHKFYLRKARVYVNFYSRH